MQQQSTHNLPRRTREGFTLIEMLVVAPLVLLVITALVSAMIAMVGDTITSTTRATTAYNIQDTLNRIEQDAHVSMNFMQSFTFFGSPQGKDGNIAPFTSAAGDLIMTQQATTSSPYDAARSLVYYKNQPNDCSADVGANRTLLTRTIYFLVTNGDGTKTLWRREILPQWNTNSSVDANTVCSAPWQRNSCPAGSSLNGSPCLGYDEKMLDNVSAFTVTYYTASGTTTSDPTQATTINIQLSVTNTAAGNTISQTSTLRATRTNDVASPALPSGPTVTVYNPLIDTYNNPLLSTFQFTSSGAIAYSVSWSLNGGSWTTPTTTTSDTLAVATPYSGSTIAIHVTALNDTGQSSQTTYNYGAPIWTNLALQGSWTWWGGGHTHPQYTLTNAGLLVMKGMIKKSSGTVSSDPLFKLPLALAPDKGTLIFPVTSSNGVGLITGRVDLAIDGSGTAASAGAYFLSLDTINFYPRNHGTYTALSPANGWTNYGYGYSNTYYITDSSTVGGIAGQRVSLQGLVARNTSTNYTTVLSGIPAIGGGDSHDPILGDPGSGPMIAGTNISTVANERTPNVYWASYQAIYYTSTANSYWTTISFAGDWHAYGSPWSTPGYIKASDGVVTLRGLAAKNSASNSETLFTLPSGYRPSETLFMLTYTYSPSTNPPYGIAGVMYINPDGTVVAFSTTLNQTWASFENISFYADGT